MDWGGRRVFLRENASEPEGKWVYVGRDSTRYHLAFVPLYIESDHRGCVCRCNFGVLRNSGDAVIRLADTVERRCRREVWCIFFRPARFTMESRTVRHWHIMCRRCGDQRWNIWVCVHTVEVDRCGWRKESRRVRGRSDGKQCRDKFHGIYADGFGKCSMFPLCGCFSLFLMVFSWQDLHRKRIRVSWLYGFGTAGMALTMIRCVLSVIKDGWDWKKVRCR